MSILYINLYVHWNEKIFIELALREIIRQIFYDEILSNYNRRLKSRKRHLEDIINVLNKIKKIVYQTTPLKCFLEAAYRIMHRRLFRIFDYFDIRYLYAFCYREEKRRRNNINVCNIKMR